MMGHGGDDADVGRDSRAGERADRRAARADGAAGAARAAEREHARATRVLELVQRSARGGRLDVSRASALAARLLAQERVQRSWRVERSLLRGIGALFGVVADWSSSHKNRSESSK